MTPNQIANILSRLDAALRAAGIPHHGVSWGVPPAVSYKDEATPRQRADGDALVAGFDLTPRRRRAVMAMLGALDALSAADRTRLMNAVQRLLVVEFLLEHPRFARQLVPPIALDGDEPDTEV